ncbi:MAG: helix-turn-helix transcriptional regulator [Luteolibacter sp.]
MRVTTKHPASSYGMPVIIDGGRVVDYATGIKAIRAKLGWSKQQLADACGVSPRTVEGWEMGRPPTAAALNVISDLV